MHALLRHPKDVGFGGAPEVLGIDEQGREVLSYLPSERVWPFAEPVLIAAARLVRRLHDALASFEPAPDAVWRLERVAGPLRVGHNDIGPSNVVFAGGMPYGFIDWELAGPRPPLYDFIFAAVNFTPLRPDIFCQRVGFADPPDRGRRLRIFCDAYGLDDRSSLVDAIEQFQRQDLDTLVELGTAGVSPHDRYLRRGEDRFIRWDLEWLVAQRDELQRALD